jgi:hypothetical protein
LVCTATRKSAASRRASSVLLRAVAEAALDADLLVQPRRVAAAEHRVQHRADRALAAASLGQRQRDDDAGLARLRHVDDRDRRAAARRRGHRRRRRRLGRRGPAAEMAPRQRQPGVGRDVAGEDQDRVVGRKARRCAATRSSRRCAAAIRACRSRMTVRARAVGEPFGDERGERSRARVRDLERVERLGADALDLVGREHRLARDLGDERERGIQLGRRHGHRDDRVVPAGAAVERAAERLGRAASSGALWRRVPCVISAAVSDASPARRGGSASAPASATSSALTSGIAHAPR